MLLRVSKAISVQLLFFLFSQNAFADPAAVNSEEDCSGGLTSCKRTFTADNQTLLINRGGNLIFSGIYGAIPFNTTTNQVSITTRASIGVSIPNGVSGAVITVQANEGEGINTSIADKGTGAIVAELGGHLKTLEVKSGIINSTDTAIFLRDSDSSGTDIIVGKDGIIQGSRSAIRYDNAACIDQDPAVSSGDTNTVNCSGGAGNYNSFTGASKDEADENAEAGVIGTLTLRVRNEGIIAANPRLTANPGVTDSNSFYSSGNSRIKSNISITNESTGKIYGQMVFGAKVFSETFDKNKAYITSEVNITNRGLISAGNIISDFNTTLNITNESNGNIRIETSPIAGSDMVTECSAYDTLPDTCKDNNNYEVLNGTAVTNPAYPGQNASSIRPQGENSTITNYGTIVGKINTSLKSQTINLNGGSVTGDITLAGTLNFNNDFASDAMIGSINTRTDRKTEKSEARINIGTKTYAIGSNGSDALGNLSILAGTGLHPIISTTFTDGGALGRLNFAGKTNIESGVRLNINIADNYSYLQSGVDYLVIDGDYKNTATNASESDVKAVADSNISINDGTLGNNKIGILTFHSAARDYIESTGKYKDLVVYIERVSIDEITDDETAKKVFENIDEVGGDSNGTLEKFQKYIDTSSSYFEIAKALRSAAPINDADIELAVMVPVHKNLEAANSRFNSFVNLGIDGSKYDDKDDHDYEGEALRFCLSVAAEKNKNIKSKVRIIDQYDENSCSCLEVDALTLKVHEKKVLREKEKLALKENKKSVEEKKYAVWGEIFGSSARRYGSQSDLSYSSKADGFVFGKDKKINKNTLIGASLGYSNSRISFSNNLRYVNVDTYQANIYGGKFYNNKIFWDAVAGIAWNKYKSSRIIPSVSETANAKYAGINYIARLRSGIVYNNVGDSELDFIPEISVTFVKRTTDSYHEKDAGTVGLEVRRNADNYLEGRIGYNINRNDSYKKPNDLKYRFHNSYGYNFLNRTQKTTANFIGQRESFTTLSDKDGSYAIRFGLGVDYNKNETNMFSLDYVLDIMQNYIAHSGIAKFTHRF